MQSHTINAQRVRRIVAVFIFLSLGGATDVAAGPPFRTDDPIPIGYHHGEIYVFSSGVSDAGGFAGVGPAVEFNYGAFQSTHLHIVFPLAFSSPSGRSTQVGYGDTELGVKYKFLNQTDELPDIATFPIIEVPTGSASRGLGNGNTQIYLPIWLQKDFGKWTVYGGAGYWINRGAGNEDWLFSGILVQYNFTEDFFLGTELFHQTPSSVFATDNTGVHIGGGIPVAPTYQVIFSADAGNGITSYKHFAYYFGLYHQM
jgi:hypothetical protein